VTQSITAAAPGKLRARRALARVSPPLLPAQIRWLGALLLVTQLPLVSFVPVWVAGFGAMLVALRFLLLRRDRLRAGALPARIPSWALALFALTAGIAIKVSFGYFLGRDPSVAFLYLLIGIKFLETRTTRDASLLVCLGSFLVVTPFFYNQSLWAAIAALPALLLLGAVLQVLALPAAGEKPVRWRVPILRAAKFFAQGIPLALLLFVLFPRLTGPLWGLPADHMGKSGLSDRMAPGTITELSLSDSVAFRVDFAGAVPQSPQLYWRGPVLTRFDGWEWTAIPRPSGHLAPPGAKPITYTVTLEPHYKPWLFALDLPAALPRVATDPGSGPPGNEIAMLTRDQQLISRTLVSQPLRYEQQSILRDAYPQTDDAQAAAETAEALRLPPGNPRTHALARELRDGAVDDRGFVRAVLMYFRNEPFVYTLSPGELFEHDVIDGFLFDSKRGFCEHYASAFVVLLRAAGVPARVVTGYQGGEINPSGGYMIVRQSDAHAWAEALIDGQWQRYDPTAAVAPSRIEGGIGRALAEESIPLFARMDGNWLKAVQLAWDAVNYNWGRHVIGFNYERQRSFWRDWKLDGLEAWQMVIVGALFALVWLGGLLGWLVWRRRHQDRARALWDHVGARLARAGLPRQPHEGPLAYAARAAARWPEFAVAFQVIGDAYAALRYGLEADRDDRQRERAAALARLARAADVLPAPAALRRMIGAEPWKIAGPAA
jgi:protein-glutamine gamma-glutamyltransferase